MSKRASDAMGDEREETGTKKQKVPCNSSDDYEQNVAKQEPPPTYKPREVFSSAQKAWMRENAARLIEESERSWAEFQNRPPRDERQDITDELESGTYRLVLERNNSQQCKCRAERCLVQQLPSQWNERIRSRYRLDLEAVNPSNAHWSQLDKPNHRFYHVSCFENIGVDIAKYLTLPAELVVQSVVSYFTSYFHPAIIDWVDRKGHVFDISKYGRYEDALNVYREDFSSLIMEHVRTCTASSCTCGLPLARPKSSDFVEGEPSACTLTDVLLNVIGASHLLPLSEASRIELLEVIGRVPDDLLPTKLASIEKGMEEVPNAANKKPADKEFSVKGDSAKSVNNETNTLAAA